MENRVSELDERINKLSTLKSIGWTAILIFGFITLWILYSIIGTFLFAFIDLGDEQDGMSIVINQFRAILIMSGLVTTLTTLGAIGILKYKTWGLILFQSTTIIYIILILAGLVYFIISLKTVTEPSFNNSLDDPMRRHFDIAQRYQTIGLGVFALLIAWILTRINVLLSKGIYRQEFD